MKGRKRKKIGMWKKKCRRGMVEGGNEGERRMKKGDVGDEKEEEERKR